MAPCQDLEQTSFTEARKTSIVRSTLNPHPWSLVVRALDANAESCGHVRHQPASQGVLYRKSLSNLPLKVESDRSEQPPDGPDADLRGTVGSRVIGRGVLHVDPLHVVLEFLHGGLEQSFE